MSGTDPGRSGRGTLVVLATLFLVSFGVRGAFLVAGPGPSHALEGDEGAYHGYAATFTETGDWRNGGAVASRPPTTPFVLTILYLVTGPDPAAARWEMVFVSSLVAPALFLVGRRLHETDPRPALITASAWTFYPPSIFYAGYIFTENLAPLLTVASLGTFVWAARRRSLAAAGLTGALWAIAAMNRPVFLAAPVVMLTTQVALQRLAPIRLAWGVRCWVAGFAGLALVMSPWIIRNYVALGAFTPTSTQSGDLLLMTNGTLGHPQVRAGAYYKNPELLELVPPASGEAELDSFRRGLAMNEIRRDWRMFPVPVLNRAKNFWTPQADPYDERWTGNDVLMTLIWVPVLLFFAASPIIRHPARYWPLLALVLTAFLTTLAFWGAPRFRFPVDPLLVFGASLGFVGVLDRAAERFGRVLPLPGVMRKPATAPSDQVTTQG